MATGGRVIKGKRWLSSLVGKVDANTPSTAPFKGPTKPKRLSPAEGGTSSKSFPDPITIDIEDVVDYLTLHKCFQLPSLAPGVMIHYLPNFDDVTRYSVLKQIQDNLWKLEVQTPAKAVTQLEPLRFEESPDLAIGSIYGYAILGNLVDRMRLFLAVPKFDREELLRSQFSFIRFQAEDTKMWMINRAILLQLQDKEDDDDASNRHIGKARAVKGSHEDFFAFVDYCTAVLARSLCQAVEGNSVQINITAHMAKLLTKVKVVSADLSDSASISLDNG